MRTCRIGHEPVAAAQTQQCGVNFFAFEPDGPGAPGSAELTAPKEPITMQRCASLRAAAAAQRRPRKLNVTHSIHLDLAQYYLHQSARAQPAWSYTLPRTIGA